MAKTGKKNSTQATAAKSATAKQRRALLKKLGRFAAVSAPTVTLLLAAKAKPAAAAVSCAPSSRAFKTRLGPVNRTKVLASVSALPIKARRG
jgi:hypothetical protein